MPVIPALRRLRQDSHKFQSSLGCKGDPVFKEKMGQSEVIHTYNPRYSRSREQEALGLKQAQAK
jgi:hypothetical protein